MQGYTLLEDSRTCAGMYVCIICMLVLSVCEVHTYVCMSCVCICVFVCMVGIVLMYTSMCTCIYGMYLGFVYSMYTHVCVHVHDSVYA